MIARFVWILVCVFVCCRSLCAQSPRPSLTIYNQDFAVVRQEIPLDLKSGENQVNVNDITMHLEPDSVILRDPTGRHAVHVLEQNYRADPISEPLLLSLYEGKTLDFEGGTPQGPPAPIQDSRRRNARMRSSSASSSRLKARSRGGDST